MKVLQTIPGLSAKSGGPSTCTVDLLNGLYDINAGVDLLTVSSFDNLGTGKQWLIEKPNDYILPLEWSRNIKKALLNSDYDLYHANTLWTYSTHITCKHARQKNKPYIISPHGMLYPTALAINRWKKIPMLAVWFNKDILNATCLHATCEQEMEHIRTFGYKGPIAVIPNCVVLPKGTKIKVSIFKEDGKRQIGFLGRLHPIKKVENLFYALDKLPCDLQSQVSLKIMGKYDDVYERWLKEEVRRMCLEKNVEFVGFVSGKEKYERLAKLTALMVPSAQENFGMIVPEALICGTPVYASLGTPWHVLKEVNAGWWDSNEPETIAVIIKDILLKSEEELLKMGYNGRRLIENKFEQHKVAHMMKRLYKWIVEDSLNVDVKPEFVYI